MCVCDGGGGGGLARAAPPSSWASPHPTHTPETRGTVVEGIIVQGETGTWDEDVAEMEALGWEFQNRRQRGLE